MQPLDAAIKSQLDWHLEVIDRALGTDVVAFVSAPDRAMSAGTIFALSADRIMMDYFSCLGPIDPQEAVLRRNPRIDAALVAAHERLEQQLRRLGVDTEPHYNIDQPLGRHPNRIHNHSRAMTRNS